MKICVAGLGLIGGSLAKAIKKNTDETVYGLDINRETIASALAQETIDGELTPEELSVCDLVILGLYPQATIDFIEANSFGDSKEKISFVEGKTLYHADTAEQATAEGILDGCKLVPSAYFNSDITYATVADVEDNYAYRKNRFAWSIKLHCSL